MLRTLAASALVALSLVLPTASAFAAPPATTTITAPAPPPVVLPVVDMAALNAAAQVEPNRGNQPSLGDDASTMLVQQALTDHGFKTPVDGMYGSKTRSAYIKYQQSLGYKSIDANGMPGIKSLTRLGADQFTVANPVLVGSRSDSYGGKRVNTRSKLMLREAASKVSWKINLSQGSYCGVGKKSHCAKASAGTHDGGGTFDVSVKGLSTKKRFQTVQALRKVGFAAWYRTSAQCSCWSPHIHVVSIGDSDLWQRDGKYTNRNQVGAYFVDRDGLAANRKDNTPRTYRTAFITWEGYTAAEDAKDSRRHRP